MPQSSGGPTASRRGRQGGTVQRRYFDHLYREICVALGQRIDRYGLWLGVWESGGDPDDLTRLQARRFVQPRGRHDRSLARGHGPDQRHEQSDTSRRRADPENGQREVEQALHEHERREQPGGRAKRP